MAFCTKCGTQTNAAVCPTCGAAIETAYNQPTYAAPQQPYGYQSPYYPQQPAEEPVSVLGWIGRSLIPCIPVVGGIVYLIMLFLWMGDKTKQETFRNWAKAQLIVMAIAVGLSVLLVIFFAVMGVAVTEAIMSY